MQQRTTERFADREEAGRRLAESLGAYGDRADVVVLALPRGGVPVAYPLARALGAELDVFPVRKLGTPGHSELAMGAVAEQGVRVLNEQLIDSAQIDPQAIEQTVEREMRELERQAEVFRGDRSPAAIEGRVAILIDDGLATGASMRAAVRAVRARNPSKVVVAVPVASVEAASLVEGEADEVVVPLVPSGFRAVGQWYEDFAQVSDDEVRDLLQRAAGAR